MKSHQPTGYPSLLLVAASALLQLLLTPQESVKAAQGSATLPKLEEFQSVADALMDKSGTPGAAIAIVYDDKVHSFTLGHSNLETRTPVTKDTLFAIGSCSKAFTGVLAAKLVSESKLKWEQPVKEIEPRFRMSQQYATNHTTIKDIFTHHTGLARHDMLWFDSSMTRGELLDKLPFLEMGTGFRERYNYNNLMFSVGGNILEKVSGKPWDELIRKRIFEPLGMKHSNTSYREFIAAPNRSTGYEPDGRTPVPHRNVDTVAPAGAIGSTLGDMTIWLKMLATSGKHHENEFLSNEEFDYLTSAQAVVRATDDNFYGIGWNVHWKNGKKSVGHGGGIDGQNCFIKFIPESKFGIVVLANEQSDFDDLLVEYAADIFVHGGLERDAEKEQAMERRRDEKVRQFNARVAEQKNPDIALSHAPMQLARDRLLYIGTFEHPAYGKLKIESGQNNKLTFSLGNYMGDVLFAGPDQFAGVSDIMGNFPIDFHFSPDSNAYLTTRLQGGDPDLRFEFKGSRLVEGTPRRSLAQLVLETTMTSDVENAIKGFKQLENSNEHYYREDEMNQAGYVLMQSGNVEAALALFKLNVERCPKSWNAWDSLGEAYAKQNNNAEATMAYKKSIQLNPNNTAGIKMLKQLQTQ